MNAIIFKTRAESAFISGDDFRAAHIREVLKPKDGDEIFVGVANCELGKTRIFKKDGGYAFDESWTPLPNPKPLPLTLSVAYARPQIAKRILFEAACFGVERVCFYVSEKGLAGYAKSSLYATGEFEESLYAGASQACSTTIPEFLQFPSLADFLGFCAEDEKLKSPSCLKIAPDLYEATSGIAGAFKSSASPFARAAVVLGGERGFSNADRDMLRDNSFTLVSLGDRVMRTDTAVIACAFACKMLLEK